MKHKRTRTIPREGPPCQRCGRSTQPRTNWQRLMAFLPVTGRFTSDHHHLCRRCYRKCRPNDRRTMPGLPRRGGAKTTTRRTEQAQNGDVAASHDPIHPRPVHPPPWTRQGAGRRRLVVTEYRIGDIVTVPCVRGTFETWTLAWYPVAGVYHQDDDLQPFPTLHFHIDPRFLPRTLREMNKPNPAGRLSYVYHKAIYLVAPVDIDRPILLAAVTQARGMDSTWFRWLTRRVLTKWPTGVLPEPGQLRILEERLANARVVNDRCPHWRLDLATVPTDADGNRTCPQHGLRWDAVGRLVSRLTEVEEAFRAGEAYEVECRLLRDGPVDPEFRAWATRELGGRLSGPRAALPQIVAHGLDEQDIVTEEDTAPLPPLPPLQAFAKAQTALAAADTEAARFRDAVAGEHASMAATGHRVLEGETLRATSMEWHRLLALWSKQQARRDRKVRDIRVLVEAASAAFGR